MNLTKSNQQNGFKIDYRYTQLNTFFEKFQLDYPTWIYLTFDSQCNISFLEIPLNLTKNFYRFEDISSPIFIGFFVNMLVINFSKKVHKKDWRSV